MNIKALFVRPLLGFFFLGTVFYVIEKIAGRSRPQKLFRAGYVTDLVYFLSAPLTKTVVKSAIILPAGLLILLGLTTHESLRAGMYQGYGILSRQPVWAQAIQIYVLVDFIGYWMHRLFHTGKWWPFHAVHHSSREVDWLASARVHPINELVNNLAQASPVLLLGYNPTLTLATAPILTFYAITLHANVNWDYGPFRKWIASPVFHRWHHSDLPEARDKNFAGFFPVWDVLFGTYYMPKDQLPMSFGTDTPMPESYLGQLWAPIAALFGNKHTSAPGTGSGPQADRGAS
jgi:sterol desaturase/sphingolipid hydroxylase (fatty acid hydroxylase superfamily)